MYLQQLRTFTEVYRQRSISGAARKLELTQPAVSQQVASLEAAIGRPLFERHARGVLPTATADELAADIGDKLDHAETALATARSRSTEIAGSVQIIAHSDFAAETIGPALRPLLEAGVRVRLQTGDWEKIRIMVAEGQCDLGFSALPTNDSRLRSEALHTETTVAVASPEVAANIMAQPHLYAALAAQPVLAYNLAMPLICAWLAENHIDIGETTPAVVSQDLRGLRSILVSGFGWSVLPEYLCREELGRGTLMEITPPVARPQNTYYAVWSPAALRNHRVAFVRQTLIWRLKQNEHNARP
ncbi:LysR family transcriptional regulator [Rhizobium sp. 2MFCol3.1]|uniref:LysR family transcriptional regulator n=1 Tax=Rhizobium sp. 2MFCol3.1 TaxID=1246459 RepID=UPI00039BF488|nr:LysR family transcriptional regulator [Rhizobium sp. 2MFCol3.1]